MSFTFVGSIGAGTSAASATTLNTGPLGFAVAAGDLVVVGAGHEESATTMVVSDGTSTFTEDPAGIENNPGTFGAPHSCWRYLLASVATGNPTYTVTFGVAVTYRNMVVFVYRPSTPCNYVASVGAGAASGTSTNSGNITTVGADGIAFGMHAEYGSTFSSPLINGIAPDQTQAVPTTGQWRTWAKTYSAGFTGAASGTLSLSNRWNCQIIAFAETARLSVAPIGQAVKRAAFYRAYPHDWFVDLATSRKVEAYTDRDVSAVAEQVKRLAA